MDTQRTFHTLFRPEQVHPAAFIAAGAVLVGDVTLDAESSVWFQTVLRGDSEPIHIGARTNIQDGCIVHVDPGYPTRIAAGCTIGHRALVHGATIGANTVIGMGAILLNGVIVGENSIVGAGALLTQGKAFPAGVLLLGSPAKVVRDLRADEIASNTRSAEGYVQRAHAFRAGVR
ncbi:MAG: gamma carbonic anhydrase family protein [Chloroflexi bacterium]|nr:gamma carbonic anhydrase family protein [Chloroflexota bacterium]